jgi:hypothetical protein
MAAKKMPWNTVDNGASTILDTTYPPALAIVISEIVMKACWPRGGIHEARVRVKFGPSATK